MPGSEGFPRAGVAVLDEERLDEVVDVDSVSPRARGLAAVSAVAARAADKVERGV